ncbi:hypothetical protein ACIOD2_47565 [Amycolatopsis sp. NPDC088138]|uniref:hypothetical protein n=1 Tax=Amycolatopsis sp. NPDC088138 TaxID=3363938 RepID=UPI0038060037
MLTTIRAFGVHALTDPAAGTSPRRGFGLYQAPETIAADAVRSLLIEPGTRR